VNPYVADADYTVYSLRRWLIAQVEAGSYVSREDLDAYERAVKTLRQQEVLWEDWDGLLAADHDTVRDYI